MKQPRDPRETLTFVVIAVILMVIVQFFLFPDYQPKLHDPREDAAMPDVTVPVTTDAVETAPDNTARVSDDIPIMRVDPELIIKEPPPPPAWQINAVPVAVPEGQAKVVIIIDDVGVDHRRSQEVIDMPYLLTLAFLPYAAGVKGMAADARAKGHEIMVHMPMEPMNPDLDTGGIVLRHDQSAEEFEKMLDEGLGAFDGYVGLNNHMGSRLTQDEKAMERLMPALRDRGLLFVDSRTIATSVAFDVAADYGVPHAERDVFLDHDPSIEGVRASLRRLERIALSHGQAIAIGHPKDSTIAGLKEWLPTLKGKGIALVPVSAVVVQGDPPDESEAVNDSDADEAAPSAPPLLPPSEELLTY
ncbi:MAG: divergent polysaccharide deacetylase family protein [Rhodospirillales bacterium]|nr:divergent polysaccharide deacetylase family protein [Rhodospirillales bacterium]